jgi:hypothetical protein
MEDMIAAAPSKIAFNALEKIVASCMTLHSRIQLGQRADPVHFKCKVSQCPLSLSLFYLSICPPSLARSLSLSLFICPPSLSLSRLSRLIDVQAISIDTREEIFESVMAANTHGSQWVTKLGVTALMQK